MRITNNMILNNTTANMNSNKLNVSNMNNQMSSQKKIQKPSENPVIAIRALRLRTSLAQVNQYYEKNIPDAESWLDVTETALVNMKTILSDVRSQCVKGATGTLTAQDRQTILQNLKALQEQVYSEGNADYAGRTVFTGYRTNSKLVFDEESKDVSYKIEQNFTPGDIESHRYYTDGVTVPSTVEDIQDATAITNSDVNTYDYQRIRLAYDGINSIEGITIKDGQGNELAFSEASFAAGANSANYTYTNEDGTITTVTFKCYESVDDWEAASGGNNLNLGEYDAVFIKDTGELVIGTELAENLRETDSAISVDYKKTGFDKGELRPEFYYNCTDITNATEPVEYVNFTDDGARIYQDISYTIASGQELAVNTQASDVFDNSIYLDIKELTNAVQTAIEAHDKVDKLQTMIDDPTYTNYKDELNKWLDAAQKEVDYADDNMQKMYSEYITRFDTYMNKVNLEITKVGSKGDRLAMTETRIANQQTTLEELKTANEDEDLSEIIINYTAAYTAYQACLQAASKVEKQSLLDYL